MSCRKWLWPDLQNPGISEVGKALWNHQPNIPQVPPAQGCSIPARWGPLPCTAGTFSLSMVTFSQYPTFFSPDLVQGQAQELLPGDFRCPSVVQFSVSHFPSPQSLQTPQIQQPLHALIYFPAVIYLWPRRHGWVINILLIALFSGSSLPFVAEQKVTVTARL